MAFPDLLHIVKQLLVPGRSRLACGVETGHMSADSQDRRLVPRVAVVQLGHQDGTQGGSPVDAFVAVDYTRDRISPRPILPSVNHLLANILPLLRYDTVREDLFGQS